MTRVEPDKLWWTAEDLAASGLPGLPGTHRGVNLIAKEGGWRAASGLARRKQGRGGGWQYHWSVLPDRAQKALLMAAVSTPKVKKDRGSAWASFDALPDSVKTVARQRLDVIQTVEILQAAGATKTAAIEGAITDTAFKARTVFEWFKMVEGIAVEDRLAFLIPRHRLAKREAPKSDCVRHFLDTLKSLYLRVEKPTFKSCYRDAIRIAKSKGWITLAERTAKRRVETEVPRVTRVFMRDGQAGLARCFPAQKRDRTSLRALEGVNADCHKIDVFVSWPAEKSGGEPIIDRPQIVAFQDLYSNKILSWRIDHDPNKEAVMAAFGEMIENFGIPTKCLFDNGHEFANKWLTGGAKSRFRFKIREDDPIGVLPLLGIEVKWAPPAHGQAKPIERGFRDFANDIATDVRFAGAYVGKHPMAKPENYRSHAVPVETFVRVVSERIAEHNAREGRTSQTANGRSFDETFAQSYAASAIPRATPEQSRLWMMGQHLGKLNRADGSLKIFGNIYHNDWMSQVPKRDVIARFNPEDLHQGVEVYAKDGEYLGFAECQQAKGFFDVVEARGQAKRVRRIKKLEKALAKQHANIPLSQLAQDLDDLQPSAPLDLETKVVAMPSAKSRPHIPESRPLDPSVAAQPLADVLTLTPAKPETKKPSQSTAEKFWWARSILEKSERGEAVGSEEARQVRAYVETAEYQANLDMFTSFGAQGVK